MKDLYDHLYYYVDHRGISSVILKQNANGDPALVATFYPVDLALVSMPFEERAEQYARIMNGQEFYREPPTEEYIRDHTYAGGDIHRAAIISRNETIDELLNTISRIARMVGVKGGWGIDYEHLFARIQEILNAR